MSYMALKRIFEKIRNILHLFKIYAHNVRHSICAYPDNFNLWYSIRIFPEWVFRLKRKSLEGEIPWVCFQALNFLKKIVNPDMRVYEFGSGGSTFFFAKHVDSVVSVEHDKEWYNLVSKAADLRKYYNCSIRLIEPSDHKGKINEDFSNPDNYASSCKQFLDKSFLEYARSIEDYPDNYFDMVLIDGRARPSCIKHSINKVKESGFLILDNSDRKYYLNYFKSNISDFEKLFDKVKSFYGPGPYCKVFYETTIWQKRSK